MSYSSIVIICLMYISQVSLESNNYSQAVEDLSKAVSIKVKTAPAGSRALAETHYQLGVAHSWAGGFQNLTCFVMFQSLPRQLAFG